MNNDKAIELNPQSSDAWNNKGSVLLSVGMNYDALMLFEKALEYMSARCGNVVQ